MPTNQSKTEILSEDSDRIQVQITDDNGRFLMIVYQVFPGIQLIYSDAHIQSVRFEERKITSDHIFEITHCREGRAECSVNGEFWYISPGDLAIARTNSISRTSYFPLSHYHGLTIRIDLEQTPKCLSCLLDDVKVRPKTIAEKFCGKKGGFLARANPSFEHFFRSFIRCHQPFKKDISK